MSSLSEDCPRFCRLTSMWLPNSGKWPRKSLATYFYWVVYHAGRKSSLKPLRTLIFFLAFLILTAWVVDLFNLFPVADDTRRLFDFAWLSAIFLLGSVPVFLSGWRSRTYFLGKIFHLDSLVAMLTAALGIQFLIDGKNERLHMGVGIFLVWLLVRLTEIRLWRGFLKGAFQNRSILWKVSEIQRDDHTREKNILAIGVPAVLVITFLRAKTVDAAVFYPEIFAYLLPLSIPFFPWMGSRLMAEAEKNLFYCQNLSLFKKLKDYRMVFAHQFGVFSKRKLDVVGTWLNKNDQWSAEEIENFLFLLTEGSDHPVAEAIREGFPKRKVKADKVRMTSRQEIPNLGIRGELHDAQGSYCEAILGGMTWHKLLQNEIAPDGMDRVKEWKPESSGMVLLSINRQIVAALAYRATAHPTSLAAFSSIKSDLKVNTGILSSQAPLFDQHVIEGSLNDSAFYCLPVERRLQSKIWSERSSPVLEVQSDWDAASTFGFDILQVVEEPSRVRFNTNAIVHGSLHGLHWGISASRKWARQTRLTTVVPLTVSVGLSIMGADTLLAGSLSAILFVGGLAAISGRKLY